MYILLTCIDKTVLWIYSLFRISFHPSPHPASDNYKDSDSSQYEGKNNTPGTRGGPGGRDWTLAVKRRKNARKREKIFKIKRKFSFFHFFSITCFFKADFLAFFLLFTASVQSRPPGPPLIPGVLYLTQEAVEKRDFEQHSEGKKNKIVF